jgi:hypothetical protein
VTSRRAAAASRHRDVATGLVEEHEIRGV